MMLNNFSDTSTTVCNNNHVQENNSNKESNSATSTAASATVVHQRPAVQTIEPIQSSKQPSNATTAHLGPPTSWGSYPPHHQLDGLLNGCYPASNHQPMYTTVDQYKSNASKYHSTHSTHHVQHDYHYAAKYAGSTTIHHPIPVKCNEVCCQHVSEPPRYSHLNPPSFQFPSHHVQPPRYGEFHHGATNGMGKQYFYSKKNKAISSSASSSNTSFTPVHSDFHSLPKYNHHYHHHHQATTGRLVREIKQPAKPVPLDTHYPVYPVVNSYWNSRGWIHPPPTYHQAVQLAQYKRKHDSSGPIQCPPAFQSVEHSVPVTPNMNQERSGVIMNGPNNSNSSLNNNMVCSLPKLVNDYHKKPTVRTDCFDLNSQYINSSYPPSIVRSSANKIMINNITAPVPQSVAPHSQNLSCQLMNVDKQQLLQSDLQYNIGESSVISNQHQHDASPTQCINVLSSSPHSNNCMVNETINCDPINYSISNNDMYNQAGSNPASVVNLKPFQSQHNVAAMEHISGMNNDCSQLPSRDHHQQHENVMKKRPDLDVRQFLVSWNDTDEDSTRFSEPQNNSTNDSVNKNSNIDDERRTMANTPTSKASNWNSSSPVPSQPRPVVSKTSSGLVTESNPAVNRISENENYAGRSIINKDMNSTNPDRNVNNCLPMISRPVAHQNNNEIHATYVNPYPNNSNRIVSKISDKGLLIDGHSQQIEDSHFQMCNGYNNWNNSSKYRNDSAVIENSALYNPFSEPNHHAYSSIRQHYTSPNPSNPNNNNGSHVPIQSNIGIGHAIVHNIQREHSFEKKSNVNIVEPIIPERNSLMFHRNNDMIDRKINHLTSESSSKGYYNSSHTDNMVQHRSVIDNGCNFINLAEYSKNEDSNLCIPMNAKTVQPSLIQEKSFLGYKSNGVICENSVTSKFPLTDSVPKVDHNMVIPQQVTAKNNPTSPIVIHFDSNDELRNNSIVSSEHIFPNSFIGEKQKFDVSVPNSNSSDFVDLSNNNDSTDCLNLKNGQRNTTSPNTLNCLSRINNESTVNSSIVQSILKSPSNSSPHNDGDNNLDGSRSHVGDISADTLFFGSKEQSSNEMLSPKKPIECSPKDPLDNKNYANSDNIITLHSVSNEDYTSISVSRISGSDCSTYVEQYTNIEQSFSENILKSSNSCNSSNVNFVQSENVCVDEVDKDKYVDTDKSSSLVMSCPNKNENTESNDKNKLCIDSVDLKPDNTHVIKMKLSKKILRKKLTPNLKLKRLPNSKGWIKISENYCSKSRKKHKSIVNSCIVSEKETSSPASSQSSVLEIVESSSCDIDDNTDVIPSGEVDKVKDRKRLLRVLSMPSLDDSPDSLNISCNNRVELLDEKSDSAFGDNYKNNTENLALNENCYNENTTVNSIHSVNAVEIKHKKNIGDKVPSVCKYATSIVKNHLNDNEKNDSLLKNDDNLSSDFESTCCINKADVLPHNLNDFHNSFELNCKNNSGKISDLKSSLMANEQKITDCSVKYFNNCSKSPEKENFIEPFSKSCNNKVFTSPSSAVCFKLSKSDSLQTSHSTTIHEDDNDDTCDYDEERLISSVECTPGSPNVEELFEDINKTAMDNVNKSDFDTTIDKNEQSLQDDDEDVNRFQSNRHCSLPNDICLNSKATQETVIKSTSFSCPSTSGNENDFDYNVSSETISSISQQCFNKNIYSGKDNNESISENVINNQSLVNTETVTSIINPEEKSKLIVNKLKSNICNDAAKELEVNINENDLIISSRHENSTEVNVCITDTKSESLMIDKLSSEDETALKESTEDNVNTCEDNDNINENIFDIESLCDVNDLPPESNDHVSKIVTFQSINNPSKYNSDSVIDLSIGSKDKFSNEEELVEKSKNDFEGEINSDILPNSQKNTECNNKSLGVVTKLLSKTNCDIEESIHLPVNISEDNCMLPDVGSTESCCEEMTFELKKLPQEKISGELLDDNKDAHDTVPYCENVEQKVMKSPNSVEVDNTKSIDSSDKNADGFERNNSASPKIICNPITKVVISKHDDGASKNDDLRHEITGCGNEHFLSCEPKGNEPKELENDDLLKITVDHCKTNEPNCKQHCEFSDNFALQENDLNTSKIITESNSCENVFSNVFEIEKCQAGEIFIDSFHHKENDDGDQFIKAPICNKLQTLNVTDKLNEDQGFNPEVACIKNSNFSFIKTGDRIANNKIEENFSVRSLDGEIIDEDNVKSSNSVGEYSKKCKTVQQNEDHPFRDEDLEENKEQITNKICNSIFCGDVIDSVSEDLSSNDNGNEEIQLCNEEVAEDNQQKLFEELPIVDTANSFKDNCNKDESFENINEIKGKYNIPPAEANETVMNTSIDLSLKNKKNCVTEKINLDVCNSFATDTLSNNKNGSFSSSSIKVLSFEVEDKFIGNNKNKFNDETMASSLLHDSIIDSDPNCKSYDKSKCEKSSSFQRPSSTCKDGLSHSSSDDAELKSSCSDENWSNKELVSSDLNNSIVELVSDSTILNSPSVNNESEVCDMSCNSTCKSINSIDSMAKKNDEKEVNFKQSSDSSGNSNTDNDYEKIVQKPLLCERNVSNSDEYDTEIVGCDKNEGLLTNEKNHNELLSNEMIPEDIANLNECSVTKLTGHVKSIKLEDENKIPYSTAISKSVIEEKQHCYNSLNNEKCGAYISHVDSSDRKSGEENYDRLFNKATSKNLTVSLKNNSLQLESSVEKSSNADTLETDVNCLRADEINEKEPILSPKSQKDDTPGKRSFCSENLESDLNPLTQNKNQSRDCESFKVENFEVVGPAFNSHHCIEGDTVSVAHKTVSISQNSSGNDCERLGENSSGFDNNESDCNSFKPNNTLTYIHDDTDLACNETVNDSIASSLSKPNEIVKNSEVLANLCSLTPDDKNSNSVICCAIKEKVLHRNNLNFTEEQTESCFDENYLTEGSKLQYSPNNDSEDCSVTFEKHSFKSLPDFNNRSLLRNNKKVFEGYCSSTVDKCLIKKNKFSKHRKSVSNENCIFPNVSNVSYIKKQLFLKTQSRLKNSLSRTLLKRYKSFLKRKNFSTNVKSSTTVGGSVPYENLKFIKNNKKRKTFEEIRDTSNNFDGKSMNEIQSSPIHCDPVLGRNINLKNSSGSQPDEHLKQKLMVVVDNVDELSPIETIVCHPGKIKELVSNNITDSHEILSKINDENNSEKHAGSLPGNLDNNEKTIKVNSLQNYTHESSLDASEIISKKRKSKHRKSITSLPLSIRRKLKLNKLKKRYNECLNQSSVSCNGIDGSQSQSDVVSFIDGACDANKLCKTFFHGFGENESINDGNDCKKEDAIVNKQKITGTDEVVSADAEFCSYRSCNIIKGSLNDCGNDVARKELFVPQTESTKNNFDSSLINEEEAMVNVDLSLGESHIKGVDHNCIKDHSLNMQLHTCQEDRDNSVIIRKTDEELKNDYSNNKLPAINVANSDSIVIIIEELCNSQDRICYNSPKEEIISSDYRNQPQSHEFSHPSILESPKKFSPKNLSPSHNNHENEKELKEFIENDSTHNKEETFNENLDNRNILQAVDDLDNEIFYEEKQFITDDFSVAEVEVGYNGEVESEDVGLDNGSLNRDLHKLDTSQIDCNKGNSEHNFETDSDDSDNEKSPYGWESCISDEEGNYVKEDQADYRQNSCNNDEFVNECHDENERGKILKNSSETFTSIEDVGHSPCISINNKIITNIVNDEGKHYDIVSISPTINDDKDSSKNCEDSTKPTIKCSLPWERVFNTSRSRKRKIKRHYSSSSTNGIEFGPAKIEFRVGTRSVHEEDEGNISCWKVIDNYSSVPIVDSNRNSCISPVVKVKRLILQRDPELTSYSEGSGSSSKEFSSSSSDEDNKDDKNYERKFQLSPSSSLTSFSVVSYSDDKFIGNDSSSSSIPKVLIRKMKKCQYKSFLKIPSRFNEPVVKITRSNVIDNLALEKKTSVNLGYNSCNFNGDNLLTNDKKFISQPTPSSPSHVFKLSDENLVDKPDCNSFSNSALSEENFNIKLANYNNNESINNNLHSDNEVNEILCDNDISLNVSSESRSQNGLLQSSQLAFQNCDNMNDKKDNEDCINNCEKLSLNKCKYTQNFISTDTVSSDINNETEKIDSQHWTSVVSSSITSHTTLDTACSVNDDNNLLVNNKFSDTVKSNSSDSGSEIDKHLDISELQGRGIKRPCEKLPSGTSLVLKKRTFKNISKYMFHCKRCLLVFNNKEEVMNHQASKHPAHQELHHCILCQRSFSSLNKHQTHIQSRSHRRLELLQRCTIHAMHRYFTGRDCPRLCPLTAAELKSFDWRPNQPGCIHFYHHPSPLQLALQENPWGMKNKDSFKQSAESSFSTSSSSSSPARSSTSSPAHAPATPFLLSPSPEVSDVLNNNSRNVCLDS